MIQFDLIQGDCLEKMQDIPDKSIDMILTDPPYGTTCCAWDTIIPLEAMWKQLKRVIKPNGAIALFSSQPFTTILISSNIDMFKYEWIWEKTIPGMFLHVNKMPMRIHENICIFYNTLPQYNPQLKKRDKSYSKKSYVRSPSAAVRQETVISEIKDRDYSYPNDIIKFSNGNHDSAHPTQKPIKLMEYLILTYTNKDETVLDFTMGSGSTGCACIETNRNFIGIELDENYFNIAKERIKKAQMSPRLFV